MEPQAASKNCKDITLDFIIKENDPEGAAVEDDIVRDLAKIGIKVKTHVLTPDEYREAELNGNYHMLFSRTWGAPYDPHTYLSSWAVPSHVEYSSIGGLEEPLSRETLFQMIEDVQLLSDPQEIANKWKEIHQAIHSQALFLPLWGTRVPYVLNQRFDSFVPSSQTYSYPIASVTVREGAKNVTVAPGAGGSLFKSVGPIHAHQYYPNQLFAQGWVYEGLVGYGQDGTIYPVLASSWVEKDLDSGGRRFTFTLRDGVKFHDGSEWNCAVAKLNFDHVLHETVVKRHSWYGTPKQLKSWECNDAGQFVLETKDRFYPLLQELTYIRPLTFAAASAFSQGLDSNPDEHNSCNPGEFGSKWDYLEDSVTCTGLSAPIGTGPFKLHNKETNAEGIDVGTVFASHTEYWGTVPDIDYVHLKYYETTEDVEADLLAGDLDMALGIGPLTAKQVQNLKFYHSDKLNVRHSDVLQHSLLVLNTNNEHTKDLDTRKAIIHAVDKSVFIEEEFAGLEQPVNQLLPFSAPYCDVDLNPKWSYDFQKAELLNCPPEPMSVASTTNDKLGGGAIAGISIAAIAGVGLIGFIALLYSREKKGKPIFTPVPQQKEMA